MMMKALLILLGLLGTTRAESRINAVLGDASGPISASETARIRTHLTYVLARLQETDRPERRPVLAALSRYIERGVFPRRTDDPYAGRRPRFVDDRGVWCAVGQLLVDSGAEALARSFATEHEYAYLLDVDSEALDAWAAAHGFTRRELAMIQPTYGFETVGPERMRAILERGADRMAVECGRVAPPIGKVALHVTSADDGIVATTTTPGPFARCVARAATKGRTRGARERIEKFDLDMELALKDPRDLFEAQLDSIRVDRNCAVRAGALARAATVEVTSNAKTFAVTVATEPQNDAVAACIAKDARDHMSWFDTGVWKLHGTRRVEIPRVVTDDQLKASLAVAVPTYVARCAKPPPEHVGVTVEAKLDAPRFTIAIETGDTDFRICVRDLLQTYLRGVYTAGGTFRIDGDVHATYP
jgi:hypothetical protein